MAGGIAPSPLILPPSCKRTFYLQELLHNPRVTKLVKKTDTGMMPFRDLKPHSPTSLPSLERKIAPPSPSFRVPRPGMSLDMRHELAVAIDTDTHHHDRDDALILPQPSKSCHSSYLFAVGNIAPHLERPRGRHIQHLAELYGTSTYFPGEDALHMLPVRDVLERYSVDAPYFNEMGIGLEIFEDNQGCFTMNQVPIPVMFRKAVGMTYTSAQSAVNRELSHGDPIGSLLQLPVRLLRYFQSTGLCPALQKGESEIGALIAFLNGQFSRKVAAFAEHHRIPFLYRNQARMGERAVSSVIPKGHASNGGVVSCQASAPIRRWVDLVNIANLSSFLFNRAYLFDEAYIRYTVQGYDDCLRHAKN